MPAKEDVRHDAASLYRFIDSICLLCERASLLKLYPTATGELFSFIKQLGDATREYLRGFAERLPTHPRLQQPYRQKLYNIRSNWFELHQYVRPALDADTLNIPLPLVDSLRTRLEILPDCAGLQFAVFHVAELNYFVLRPSAVTELAENLAIALPQPPRLNLDLSMIGIPYSQSSSLFSNVLISHEIGHSVYERTSADTELLPVIEAVLTKSINEFSKLSVEVQTWFTDRLLAWCEEVFCDLFATWLTGPCYTFAFLEMFDITGGIITTDKSKSDSFEFSDSHPADLFRIKQLIRWLKNDGWWADVASYKTHLQEALRTAELSIVSDFRVAEDVTNRAKQAAQLPTMFESIAGYVHEAVEKRVKDQDNGIASYRTVKGDIESYLHSAVVPSSIVSGTSSKQGGRVTMRHPGYIELVNSAYKVYLESLDTVIRNDPKGTENTVKDVAERSRWTNRIEAWTMKALSDRLLLGRETTDVGSIAN